MTSSPDRDMKRKPLGTRCQAQQIVLGRGVDHYRSWRDVDDEIKRVERELLSRITSKGEDGDA